MSKPTEIPPSYNFATMDPGFQFQGITSGSTPNANQQNTPVLENPGVQTVQVNTTSNMFSFSLGPGSATVTCPSCGQIIRTRISTEATPCAYICCCVMLLFICWPCSCIPFCMDSFRNVIHKCPKCKSTIGVYKRN